MNNPVNFKIAKLLKEKGFDSVMKEHYTETKLIISDIISKYNWNKFTDMSGNSNYYSAPTIADVIIWLHNKYGIWISVDRHYDKFISKNDGVLITFYGKRKSYFDTPTKAYETAIEYCLTKII